MKKYPRTPHLPFSPGLQNDDRRCDPADLQALIDNGVECVLMLKLDGGNTCLKPDGIFARTHSFETACPTFNFVKSMHYHPNKETIQKENIAVFGENMFAVHTITYTELTDYFYVFGVVDLDTEEFHSVEMMKLYAELMNMQIAPIVYEGTIASVEWLEQFINEQMKTESAFGGEKEGFVIRVASQFPVSEFGSKVFKWVRRNHVATDQFWRQNWKQQPKLTGWVK